MMRAEHVVAGFKREDLPTGPSMVTTVNTEPQRWDRCMIVMLPFVRP